MTEPTSAAPETAESSTAQPTAEDFKERFPGAESETQGTDGDQTKAEIPTTRLHLCSDGKHRNDEQYEQYKKYEERLELKKQQFKKDPDQFVHVDDLVLAVINSDRGHNSFMGRYTLQEIKAAAMTLFIRLTSEVQEFEYNMKMKEVKDKGLVGPDGKPLVVKKTSGIIS